MQITDIILSALFLSVVLLGIHSYLGFRVIKKGIIFADIAIAQWAALGVSLSLLLGKGDLSWFFSLLFALLSSFFVYLAEKKGVLQEAFIGVLYAMGSSWVVLLLSRSPSGNEDFMRLVASDILFVTHREVLQAALLYTVIGILFYFARLLKPRWENLTFYLLFGVTVSSSVKLVGVLVVFALLLAPPLVSLLLKRGLVFAWVYGSVVNTVGVLISYYKDLPTGFTIVGLHTLLAVLLFLSPLSPKDL
ncbi:ABC-3 protein [Thermocrinis albus DSM 14484]|uniref:ABC-3 protein n=1 Tax=Thermocrinis albus (strain DSM 14484 / JCM 11386 / HI 11/12) TaxID=638303 RepID=D3SLT9_THEAH|nr:metal ABC transporter permease [Thermocrinis albus]ADC89719.1 ABC-3 protein [Thermocrinis albus DSM 14484]